MSKWKTVKLGEVATYINGFAFKPSDWCETGLPIIRIQNLTNSSKEINYYDKSYNPKYEVNKGDILISWSASLGVYEWKKGKALLNQHIFKVVFDKLDIDKKFFVYSIQTLLTQMAEETHGATMKHITKPKFDNMPFPLPSLEEQKRIADILDKASNLIDLRKQQLEKMDLLIKSKFIDMFGDSVTNPKGWEVKNLGELSEICRGGSPRPIDKYIGGTIPWIKIGDATKGNDLYLFETAEHIIEEGVKKSRLVKQGSLIFANCGVSLGFARIIQFDGCIHDGWLAFENIDRSMDKLFLLKSINNCTEHFRKIAPEGTQPNLNTSIMKLHKQIVPPISLQTQFTSFVEQVEKQKAVMQQSLEKMETNYKALMQEYFG